MIRWPDPNILRPSPTLIMDRPVDTRRLLWVTDGSIPVRAARPFYPQQRTSSGCTRVSEKCQTRKSIWPTPTSGLPLKADVRRAVGHVRRGTRRRHFDCACPVEAAQDAV